MIGMLTKEAFEHSYTGVGVGCRGSFSDADRRYWVRELDQFVVIKIIINGNNCTGVTAGTCLEQK